MKEWRNGRSMVGRALESLLGKMQLVAFLWLYIVSGMQGVEMRACCATVLLTGEHSTCRLRAMQ